MTSTRTLEDELTAEEKRIARRLAGLHEGDDGDEDIDALRSELEPSREALVFQHVASLLEKSVGRGAETRNKELTSYFVSRSPSEETLAHGHPGALP